MMRTGTFRYAALRRVVYGRPVAEVLAEEAARTGARRLLLVGSRALAEAGVIDSLAAQLGDLCAGSFTAVAAHSPRSSVMAIVRATREAAADQLVAEAEVLLEPDVGRYQHGAEDGGGHQDLEHRHAAAGPHGHGAPPGGPRSAKRAAPSGGGSSCTRPGRRLAPKPGKWRKLLLGCAR